MEDFLQQIIDIKELIHYVSKKEVVSLLLLGFIIFLILIFRKKISIYIGSKLQNNLAQNTSIKKYSETNAIYRGPVKTNSYISGMFQYAYRAIFSYYLEATNFTFLMFSIGQIVTEGFRLVTSWRDFLYLLVCNLYKSCKILGKNKFELVKQIQTNTNIVKRVLPRKHKELQVESIKQEVLKPSNIVQLCNGDIVPADCIFLGYTFTRSENEIVMMNEVQLDGETSLKQKFPICSNELILSTCDFFLENGTSTTMVYFPVENSPSVFKDEGVLRVYLSTNHDDIKFNVSNVLYAGTTITSGNSIYALVNLVGQDCKVRSKTTSEDARELTPLQSTMDFICSLNVMALIVSAGFITLIIRANYDDVPSFFVLFLSSALFIKVILPLSYIFYSEDTVSRFASRIAKDNNVEIASKGQFALQSKPTSIITDKTGTLTTNETVLIKILSSNELIASDSVKNILACSGILASKTTGTHINTNNEELSILEKSGITIMDNTILGNHSVKGSVLAEHKDQKFAMERLYWKDFDHISEIKCAIIKVIDEKDTSIAHYEFHCQGIPETIMSKASFNTDNFSKKIDTFLANTVNKNQKSYRRLIGHGSKSLSHLQVENFLSLLNSSKTSTEKIELVKSYLFTSLSSVNIYVFEDLMRPGVEIAIKECLNNDYDFSVLTGDKYQATMEVATAVELLHKGTTTYHVEDLKSLEELHSRFCILDTEVPHSKMNNLLFIHGKFLSEVISTISYQTMPAFAKKLVDLFEKGKFIKFIYRATPSGKEEYVRFRQNVYGESVLMIGDANNDANALKVANLGIAIHGESDDARNASDVYMKEWNQIPKLLQDCSYKNYMAENIAKWHLTQHFIKAYSLLMMCALTGFTQITDSESFLAMICFKISVFILSSIYCNTEDISEKTVGLAKAKNLSFASVMKRSILVGLTNTIIVNSFLTTTDSLSNILLSVFFFQLVTQMQLFRVNSSTSSFREKCLKYALYMCWITWYCYNCHVANVNFIQTIYMTLVLFFSTWIIYF